MSKLLLLKTATNLHGVANVLGIKPAHLSFNLYKKADAQKYTQFQIPKKYGGFRNICAPIADLKHIQGLLADLLLQCSFELDGKYNRQAAHGFAKKKSILTNAHEHRGRAYVFNVDLKDFFGSINFGRVRGFFIGDKDFGLDPKAATVLAQIACFNNALPQGSPSSPVISNLVANVLDTHLVHLAWRHGCTYTRYADDLTFSTNRPEFPTQIASELAGKWTVGTSLERIITHCGFTINNSKVRMQYDCSRQMVTGLVTNAKANTPAPYRSMLRAMANRLFRTGEFHHEWFATGPSGEQLKQSTPGTLDQLQGMLAHVAHVDNWNKEQRIKARAELEKIKAPGRNRLYRRFFFYSQFYAAPLPVILCEGKTDNTYLVHAIRSRAAKFPALASVVPPSEIKLLIRIFKYIDKNAGRVLELSGGQGELAGFIAHYLDDCRDHFKAPGVSKNPVILVVDCDSGGRSLYNAAAGKIKRKLDMHLPFQHVAANVYLVSTPLPAGVKESCIEECFTPATLNMPLDGTKKFNYKSKEIDKTTEYGKHYFAEYVVKPNAASIDFTGFDPLLTRIEAAIAHYATLPK